MKLTKEKLEQLIIEEMRPREKSMDRKVFDKRRQYPKGATIRSIGDEDKPTNYPEYADKLTTLASSGPEGYSQAKELADTLDEPLDIELDSDDMQTFDLQSNAPYEMQYDLWFDYVTQGYADNFLDPIDPDQFRQYILDSRAYNDRKEIYDELEAQRKKVVQKTHINVPKTGHERTRELEKLHGFDFRPDWMKKSKPKR